MSRTGIGVLALGLAIAWPMMAADPEAAPAPLPEQPRAIALVGGLIRTQTEAGDFVGTVVIRDGKIVAVGPNVPTPPDARRIDVAGHQITPGLIDARGSFGLHASSARESSGAGTLNILDAVDPYADDWRGVAGQGITAVAVQPGGSFGGAGTILRVRSAQNSEELAIQLPTSVATSLVIGNAAAPAAPVDDRLAEIMARLGITAQQARPQTTPSSPNSLARYAQYEQLKNLLDGAKKYADTKPTKKDPAKELLVRVIKKEVPLRIEVAHTDDVRHAVKLASDFGIRVVIERADKAQGLPDELKASGVSLVLGPFYQTESRVATPAAAPAPTGGRRGGQPKGRGAQVRTPTATGPKAAISTGTGDELRAIALDGRRFVIGTFGEDSRASASLRIQAAAAIAEGYPRDKVLHALTRGAAELFGVADKLGAIAPGRAADLAVFAGDPLDPSVAVRMVICQGSVTHDAATTLSRTEKVASADDVAIPDRLPVRYLLKTTRLLGASGEYAPGELIIENGKVASGSSASRSGLPIIDVGDAPVTPGLVVAHHPLGGEDTADADASHLRAADGITIGDPALRSFRDAGFLSVVVAPGSANVIAGQTAFIRGSAISESALKFVLASSARNADRYPASLVGQIELINARLKGDSGSSDYYIPSPIRVALLDQRARALEPVLTRRQTALFEVSSRAEVRAALKLIKDHNLRGVIVGPKALDDLAEEIRTAKVPVVASPIRPQDSDQLRRSLAELGQAGVPIAFGSGSSIDLRSTAAWLVQAGLSRAAARRGLTTEAAASLGLPAGTARLSAGDPADFVVWTGCPLDMGSRPQAVIVDGQRVRRGS